MEKTYTFPKGCSVKSITLRETTGKDEEVALRQAEVKGSFSLYSSEMLRLAVTKVDGQRVTVPPDVGAWNTKTRLLAKRAFDAMNGVGDEEMVDFLQAADAPEESAAK